MTRFISIAAAVLLVVLVVAGAYYLAVGVNGSVSANGRDWAEFGSYFGGVAGPLLSSLSILLLVYTILQQRQEMSDAAHETLKRDLLAHVTKADDEIERWLQRELAMPTRPGDTLVFGDIVWGLLSENLASDREFRPAVARLHKLTSLYCEALGLYRANIDNHFIFSYHRRKAETLLEFLKRHQACLSGMAGPSLEFCQMHLDGRSET